MTTFFNNLFNNIKLFLKNNFKTLLFLLAFVIVIVLYNLNYFSINQILKRGTILLYTVEKQFDTDKIQQDFSNKNIKYNFIELEKNNLAIAIPLKAKKDKIDEFNKISDYVFEIDNSAKLDEILTLNDYYSKPFNGLLNFVGILLTSFGVWIIFLSFFYSLRELFKTFANDIKHFFIKIKESFLALIQKTKERGIKYLLRKILFDETDDDKEIDYTKEIIGTIVFVILAVIVIRYFIGELRWIPSGSMRPTILEKDRVFVEKLDFPKKEIKRGDILVFYPPDTKLSYNPIAVFSRLSGIFCSDMAFIKRVIALPNEKFEIKKDNKTQEFFVYINDKKLDEPYIISNKNWSECSEKMFCGPFVIPENNYFMMGDNRGNSQDSRFWGFLDNSRIIGRATFMFWPISRINLMKDEYLKLNQSKTKDGYNQEIYILNRY